SEVGAATVLSGGGLVVGDSAHPGAVLTGNVTVNSGGGLSGVGKIAGNVDVMGGGSLAPGASNGTLTVTGNVGFQPGSVFIINATPTEARKLAAGGTATLTGGTVNVPAQSATYAPSTQYTILTAAGAGGLNGTTFTGVTTNLAFLTPSLSYNANNVFLTLTTNGSGGGGTGGGTGGTGNIFATVTQTRNQTAVATALDPNAASNPLVLALLNQTADGALQAFDALSG